MASAGEQLREDEGLRERRQANIADTGHVGGRCLVVKPEESLTKKESKHRKMKMKKSEHKAIQEKRGVRKQQDGLKVQATDKK